jgi:hypothetical protein
MKIFFDTNVYVAEALLGQAAVAMISATQEAGWRIFCSDYVLDELVRVLAELERLLCTNIRDSDRTPILSWGLILTPGTETSKIRPLSAFAEEATRNGSATPSSYSYLAGSWKKRPAPQAEWRRFLWRSRIRTGPWWNLGWHAERNAVSGRASRGTVLTLTRGLFNNSFCGILAGVRVTRQRERRRFP